eukprot:CAMPEP_0194779804 /NCGR_PEP_ID=MMETSP0323_2-20130528/71981_1 /TAXON_ID=2866 ORGANISM="Crypthecodinium cohnii, Strain Seligo" /NCGR_SAMPLE_ID=MMETSP0323_2 /ASSEMBLY_ACC=CAM_ASM_000346 /LENGTH=121 /DNA_ID=CAMNT_0039717567 /DNA_START=87 /DNA_END=451 /DNA_ORIENTATION=+
MSEGLWHGRAQALSACRSASQRLRRWSSDSGTAEPALARRLSKPPVLWLELALYLLQQRGIAAKIGPVAWARVRSLSVEMFCGEGINCANMLGQTLPEVLGVVLQFVLVGQENSGSEHLKQ